MRRDFEQGRLQPRITARLDAGGVSRTKRGASGANGEISDFALDARQKINQAIEHLGPELSGVALDVCCFLKGLELVERERQWPPRSAKLMLRTALSKLARHYGFETVSAPAPKRFRFWGEEGYRPTLDF